MTHSPASLVSTSSAKGKGERGKEGQSPADRWHKAGTGLELVGTAWVPQSVQVTGGTQKPKTDLDLMALAAETRHAYHTLIMQRQNRVNHQKSPRVKLEGLQRDRCVAEAA